MITVCKEAAIWYLLGGGQKITPEANFFPALWRRKPFQLKVTKLCTMSFSNLWTKHVKKWWSKANVFLQNMGSKLLFRHFFDPPPQKHQMATTLNGQCTYYKTGICGWNIKLKWRFCSSFISCSRVGVMAYSLGTVLIFSNIYFLKGI